MGGIWPNELPEKIMVEWEYILPTKLTASVGYPRSHIIAKSWAWSMEPKAFLKSM
jgi:hypothetical protein